jgi:hypothetical protein
VMLGRRVRRKNPSGNSAQYPRNWVGGICICFSSEKGNVQDPDDERHEYACRDWECGTDATWRRKGDCNVQLEFRR